MTTFVSRISVKAMAVSVVAVALTSMCPPAQASTRAAGMRFGPSFVTQPAFDAAARYQIGVSPADRGAVQVSYPRRDVRDFGRMRSDKPVEVGFIMRFRHEAQLAQLTLAQSQRNSPYYHRFLKPAQFVNYFAPEAATYARTIETLERRGFRITQTFANRSAIRATAPAGVVERYFQTELHQVFQPNVRNGYRHINVRPGIIPSELRGSIVSVSGLNSTVMVQPPIRYQNKAIRHRMLAQIAAARRAIRQPHRVRPATAPTPIGTSTPSNTVPGPDPTESPNDPTTDYENSMGYFPATFADAYDYPVQHGYGGGPSASTVHAAGSVIYYDYSDSDANQEFTEFDIGKRTGGLGVRRCSDPTATPYCDGIETGYGNPNPPAGEGEATLDAETIMSLAPAAPFYEYLAPQADDLSIQFAYELVVSDDYVDAVNSSFGGCEAADPDGEFADNYIAMEGAALGITFSASSGDTGSTGCGAYVTNGAPQSEVNVEQPAAATYFTAVGGTDFFPLTSCSGVGNASLTSPCYTHEDVWTFGGGGYSIFEPEPAFQATVTAGSDPADVSTTGRNVPDLVFTADPDPPGTAMIIVLGGSEQVVGGTSLASPMWVAMVTTINQVQDSRSGWLDPSLYAIYYAQNCMTTGTTVCGTAAATAEGPFAFRNLVGGANGVYTCADGFNDACGLGSPLGWELAASLYGTPGGAGPAKTPGPTPVPTPTSPGATPTPTATPSPTPAPTLTPSGTNYQVKTIGGTSGCQASTDGTGTLACFNGPAGITYVPSSAAGLNTQSTTDNYVFVIDFATGYLRALDLSSGAVTTENTTEFAQATAGADVQGIGYFPTGAEAATWDGLYFLSEGGTTGNGWYYATLPISKNGTVNAGNIKALSGQPAAIAFNTTTGSEAGIVNAKNGDISCITFAAAESLTFEGGISTGSLPSKGNYGIAFYPPGSGNVALPAYYVTDSGANQVYTATDVCAEGMASTVAALTTGAPLNLPKEIVYDSGANGGSGAFFIANEGGNNILRLLPGASTATVVAGNGAAAESDGYNTGAAFNAPFGITTDNTNLYVTDSGGNTVREITAIP